MDESLLEPNLKEGQGGLRDFHSILWLAKINLVGKKYDRLHYENQVKLSGILGYRKKNGLEPVEYFLKDLHNHMETIKQNHFIFLHEIGAVKKCFKLATAARKLRYGFSGQKTANMKIEKDM